MKDVDEDKIRDAFEYFEARLSAFKDRIDVRYLGERKGKLYVEVAYPMDLEAIIRGISGYAVYDALSLFGIVIKPIFRIKEEEGEEDREIPREVIPSGIAGWIIKRVRKNKQ